MLRRSAITVLVALAAALVVAGASAADGEGARLAVVERLDSGQGKITLVDALGRRHGELTAMRRRDLQVVDRFAWSPDGQWLAFGARTGKSRKIFLMPAKGGRPRPVPGTKGGVQPVFSPDGRSLAFTRWTRRGRHRYPWGVAWDFESAAVWVVDLQTRAARRLTALRHHLEHLASSFSPDGSTLLVTRWDIERGGEPEVVALRFDGRTSRLLLPEAFLPIYSPDGSNIALFRLQERKVRNRGPSRRRLRWRFKTDYDLYVIDADGSHLRRLTQTPHKDEIFASWDPSGERIAYTRFVRGRFESPSSIAQINADGTCASELLSRKGTVFYGAAWQPGPGREAGRIAC